MMSLDDTDKLLLTIIQRRFPLVRRPYTVLGSELSVSENEALERTTTLRNKGPIRQISAIFNTRPLGYRSTLAAFRIPSGRLQSAAQIVSAHPGVSHNYSRDHQYNLWFTIAVPPTSRLGLEKTVEILGREAGAASTLLLPPIKAFKIAVTLDLTQGSEGPPFDLNDDDELAPPDPVDSTPPSLTAEQIELVRNLQNDIPSEVEPFRTGAEAVGFAVDDYLLEAQALVRSGHMRRFAAVLHHREAGFVANALGIWAVPGDKIDEVGRIMASFRDVSHCYQRPTYPGWPYSIFTMVHARSRTECAQIIEAIARATAIDEHRVLYSVRDYKKVRVKYFTPEIREWEESRLGSGTF